MKPKRTAEPKRREAEVSLTREAKSTRTHPTSPPCPCEGLDPFCETCVPFGRHLDRDSQVRRRAYWGAQEALFRRVEKYKRNHAGERLPNTFPDLAECRTVAGLSPGALAARACIGVRQLQRIEADPVQHLEPSLVLRLRIALGILRERRGESPEPPEEAPQKAQERPPA